ncbi:MAG: nucleotide exchange factor GrpE [Actinobacteria bacterium]|nr:nucleotide exchange factor GrpE [Actinomycetota bacterium]MCG2789441.1 nucleotide exchange factor GrpE [Actinomycetes bacterium]
MENKKHKGSGSGNGEDKEDVLIKQQSEPREEKKYSDSKGPKDDKELLSEVKELQEEIDLLRKELSHYKKIEEEYLDRLKRVHADYDNYRKRVLKEQVDIILRANKELIEKLLPVIDSFEQALEMGEDLKSVGDDFYKGVKMIFGKLMDVMQKEGIAVINPAGEEFNPHICEAVITESVKDVEEGTVLEVLRKGYKLNDFLIRPAVVKVCKKN